MTIRSTHPRLGALVARLSLTVLTALLPTAVWGQSQPVDLVAVGLQQLDAARAAPSAAAFETAEDTFTKALARVPADPRALVHRGEVRLVRGGGLASAGQISAAVAMIQAAMADMDRAVSLAPDQLDVRLTRGLAYAGFPPYYGKADTARGEIGHAVEGFAGLLGKHLVRSIDKPGMFIIFTWWSSKQTASDFYYSDLHQSWLRGRGRAMTSAPDIPEEAIPTQVGVEVLAALPGGVQINGGFVPRELFERLQRQNGTTSSAPGDRK